MQRHEGHAAAGDNMQLRLEEFQDPANTNEASRKNADDVYKKDASGQPKQHHCNAIVTCINDPDAFATAVARAVEHPDVRSVFAAANSPAAPKHAQVLIPISQALGSKGHEYCDGYRLESINGSIELARQNRKDWVNAGRNH